MTSPSVVDVYDYDQNGNLLAILDGRANAPSDREMSYDKLEHKHEGYK